MKEDENNDSILELPKLAEIFEALRRGKHLSVRDGDMFHALKRQGSMYEAIFAKLGFKLVQHPRDFFYFFDTTNFTELSARMAVFMFILVESLADKGDSVEETVLTRRFTYKDLPHLQGERCQTYMREAGVTTPEDLAKIVQTMERFGFARRMDEESFVFEVSIYRFLDLCMEMAADAEEQQAHSTQSDTNEEAQS
jgi:hypothetical protein